MASRALQLLCPQPPPNGITGFVCSPRISLQPLVLTRDLAHRTQLSSLKSAPLPPQYGGPPSNSGISSNGSDPSPPPYSFPSVIPGLAFITSPASLPLPTFGSFRDRKSSRGLAICFAIILLQTVLIICRSDALAQFIDLESSALAHQGRRPPSRRSGRK